jgi:dihydroorotate dehydrogenase (NAD+) catalytic subunit
MITIQGKTISTVAVSTIFGHGGNGMFPLKFSPKYQKVLEVARKNGNTIFTKSTTANARIGNYHHKKPWTYKFIRNFGPDTLLNAYGLTNEGAIENAKKIRKARKEGFQVIPNIFLEYAKDSTTEEIIGKLVFAVRKIIDDNKRSSEIIKLNISCPNSGEEVKNNTRVALEAVDRLKLFYPNLIIIAKLGYDHPVDFARELEDAGVDILQAINTIPFTRLFPTEKSPLASKGGGGLSGKTAQEASLRKCEEFRKATRLPMIMSCGIVDIPSAKKFFDSGADAISICTVVKTNPEEAKRILTYNWEL